MNKYGQGGKTPERDGVEDRKWLGSILREQRKRLGLTQDDAGASIGVSRAQISNIESGKHRPSVTTLLALMRLYGIGFRIPGGKG